MARISVRMPNGEGIGAGQTATFKLPVGRRFHSLSMLWSTTAGDAFDVSKLSEIRLYLNGQLFHRYSGAQRDVMNQFDGRAPAVIDASDFLLVIPFDRYRLLTLAGEEETAVNTASADPKTGQQITSFYMEVDIAAGVTGAIGCVVNAEQSEAQPGGPGTLMYTLPFNRYISGAGTSEISDLPRGSATSLALNRTFMNPTANNIQRAVIERNQYIIHDRTATYNTRYQTDGNRVPQAGWYVIDKTERGMGGDPIDLVGASDFRYRLTVDGAMTVNFVQEYLGTLAS